MAWQPIPQMVVVAASGVAVSTTGDTNENTLATITIPPMGANDQIIVEATWSYTNSANTKTLRGRLGGGAGTTYLQIAPTTTASVRMRTTIANRNATNSQVGFAVNGSYGSATANANVTSAVQTSGGTTLVLTGQNSNSGETITLETYTVTLIRGA